MESKIGEPLNWERMDDRRASRIALYHGGSIDDPKEDLTNLRSWAIDGMNKFFNALVGPASKALMW